ncbi:unnamed protein product, partial [Meganyctiphanes norvegica]
MVQIHKAGPKGPAKDLAARGRPGPIFDMTKSLKNAIISALKQYDHISKSYWQIFMNLLIKYCLNLRLNYEGHPCIVLAYDHNRIKASVAELTWLVSAVLFLKGVCLVGKIAKVFAYTWEVGWFLCKAIHYLQNVSAICSVLNLTALSLERYYAILFPFRSKYVLTVRQAQRVTVVVWIASLLLSTPILLVQIHSRVGTRVVAYWCHRDWESEIIWRAYETYMLVLVLLLPTVVMGFAYSVIGYTLLKVVIERSSLVEGIRISNGRRTEDDRDMKQILTMLLVVVVLFFVSWAPLLITNMLQAWDFLPRYSTSPFFKHFKNAVQWLAYSNSCINPLVYGFLSKNFRASFYAAMCPCLRPARPPIRTMSWSHTRTTSVVYKDSIRMSMLSSRPTNL